MDCITSRRASGNVHRNLVGHTLRKGPFGRSKFGRYNKIYLRNICCDCYWLRILSDNSFYNSNF